MSEKISKQDGEKKIQELTQSAMKSLWEAEQIADATGNDFSFSVAYGMGGHYFPDPKRVGEWEGDREDYDWVSSDDPPSFVRWMLEWDDTDEGAWRSSSASC